jgi:serine/threonine-protein kinase
MALLTGEPRSANVVVPDGCQCDCLVLLRRDVEPAMRANPQVARFLTDILGERLLASNSLRELGKYRIVGELGRGAMARVFDGFHTELGRSVAIKMLNHSLVYEKDFAERFLREAKLIAELVHPNIVHVYDFTHAYGTWFIVMERLRGVDLYAKLEREGPLPPDLVRSIVEQAAQALDAAHQASIIHRDVKPSNMFLEPNGAFKLVDFGIAVSPGDEAFQKEIACTPEYAAPELVAGETPDGRTDIYSLGLSAWTLLAGRDWATGDNMQEIFVKQMIDEVTPIEQVVPGVPADLARVIRMATAKNVEDRYQTCRQLLADLEAPTVKVDKRPQMMLSAMYSDRQKAEVRKLFAEFRQRLNALPGVDVRQAELPFGDEH